MKKWVDYSSKYGLGYLLSNGSTGVFFNDSTKILLDPAAGSNTFYYYERKAINANEKQDVMQTHQVDNYPKELHKKVTLMQHFRSYLETHDDGTGTSIPETAPQQPMTLSGGNIYVKKWMRTKHAIMFRLSNKIVQVNFQDHTEILLNSESRLVTYVNKKGERQTLPLSEALESNNAEMTKRLKYTKDILTHMLNNNAQAAATATIAQSAVRQGSGSLVAPAQPNFQTTTSSSRAQAQMGLGLGGSGLSSKRTLVSSVSGVVH